MTRSGGARAFRQRFPQASVSDLGNVAFALVLTAGMLGGREPDSDGEALGVFGLRKGASLAGHYVERDGLDRALVDVQSRGGVNIRYRLPSVNAAWSPRWFRHSTLSL